MGWVTMCKYTVTCLKERTGESEEPVIARQWLSIQAPLAMDMHATRNELLEAPRTGVLARTSTNFAVSQLLARAGSNLAVSRSAVGG
jgi:hypothetical protein